MICKSIETDEGLIPKRGYDEKEYFERGIFFSDGYLSRECFIKDMTEQEQTQILTEENLSIPKYDRCPE